LQRRVDHLPLPAMPLAVVERHQHADGAVLRGQGVADRDAAAHRHAAGLAVQVAQAAHRLADGAEAGQVAAGPGLAAAAGAQHHQPRVQCLQQVPAQAEPSGVPGQKFADQHVGFGDRQAGDVLALGSPQVQPDRAPVARLHLPPHRGAVLQQPPAAQRVAALGRLQVFVRSANGSGR